MMRSVSVVVCTLNRPESLARTLGSISEAISQSSSIDIQVVIVDNGSRSETFDVMRKWASKQSVPVRMRYEKRRGLSRARNAAIASATGELVVFTDDDCCLDSEYFTRVEEAYRDDIRPVMRGGRVELGDPTGLPYTVKTDDIQESMNGTHFPGGFILGANMIIPAAILRTVGMFDERFGAGAVFKAAEDTDYIYRVYRAGFSVEYDPAIKVKHFHGRKQKAEISKLHNQYNVGNGALYAKYIYDQSLLRHAYYDLRKLLKGQKHDESLGLSYLSVLIGNAKGFFLFWLTRFLHLMHVAK